MLTLKLFLPRINTEKEQIVRRKMTMATQILKILLYASLSEITTHFWQKSSDTVQMIADVWTVQAIVDV